MPAPHAAQAAWGAEEGPASGSDTSEASEEAEESRTLEEEEAAEEARSAASAWTSISGETDPFFQPETGWVPEECRPRPELWVGSAGGGMSAASVSARASKKRLE